jgi:hypothetical protein
MAWQIGYGASFSWIRELAGGLGRHIAHGVANGLVAVARGGKFRSGFWGGLFGSAAPVDGLGGEGAWGTVVRTVTAAVVGGTAAVLGGGKFANGAIAGAFVRLFNHEELIGKKPEGDFVQLRDPQSGKLMWVHRDYADRILMQTGRLNGVTKEQVVSSLDDAETVFGSGAAGFGAAGQMEVALPAAGIALAAKALKILIEPPTPREFGADLIDQAISVLTRNPTEKAFFEIVGPAKRIEEYSR